MRDTHRMKEKFDLSLDNRQVMSLLVGGIVVMGAVFVLGVVVGKKLATSESAADAPDLLTLLDKKAEAMQEVRKEPPLTFQDELTKKAPPLAVAEPAPPPQKAPEPARPPEPQKVAEPAKAAAPAEVVAARAVAKVEPAVPSKVDQTPVPTRTAASEGGLKDAFARAQQPAPAKPPAEAKTGGAWTLQLSSSQSKDEADKFAARLRDRGYAPFIVQADVPGRGLWYRVRMGSFPTKEAASRYLLDFKRETQMDAFVAANN